MSWPTGRETPRASGARRTGTNRSGGTSKLGKTNPEYSTSGLNATIGAFYASTGISGELSEARLDDSGNRAFVRSIEQSTVHYGDTTLTFTTNLRRADEQSEHKAMSYISAVTLEESTVAAYNAGYPCGALSDEKECEKTTKPETPLVSFYPTDGILFSDHPYIKLNGMSAAKKAVADDFRQSGTRPLRGRTKTATPRRSAPRTRGFLLGLKPQSSSQEPAETSRDRAVR